MQWNANELAWAKKNNVQLGQKKKGGLMNVSAYRQSVGAKPQGGSALNRPAGGGANPAGWTTAQRTEAVKKSANPFDDRVAGKPFTSGDSKFGPSGGKMPTDWKAYGAAKVNQDLKWQYDQGKTGFTTYEAYLKDHYNRIGKYENRFAKPEAPKASAPRRGGSELTIPEPVLKAPSDPIDQEERDEISKPADGLEGTIKTNPSLLRERRRRSYLTAG